VWSQPAVDAERNRIYISTGDNYSNPPARESDAIMALAMDTGRVLWIQQTLANDAWNVGCLETGAGRVNCPGRRRARSRLLELAVVGVLPDGKRIIIAGQKSGELFGLNPDTGEQLWKTRVGQGGVWAASNGASASMRRRRTCRSRMRSRRNLVRRAEWSR
jgi:polyvinyl alcohol dehydrogenase (cytochrome)